MHKALIKVEQWIKISLKEKGIFGMQGKSIENDIELDLTLQCTKGIIYECDLKKKKTIYGKWKQKVDFDNLMH